MQTDRETVIRVIKALSDELSAQHAGAAQGQSQSQPNAASATEDPLANACKQCGISVEDYKAALNADPSLADLEREATKAAMVGSTDPGPYDAISRESPSGQPGDLTKPRTLPRSEAPGGS